MIWKEINNFPDYQVSDTGEVRSTKYWGQFKRKNSEGLLQQRTYKSGYKYVNLYKDGHMYSVKIHRLVAHAFLPNPNGYSIINHKDENRSNNSVNNLEWCSHKYNLNYGNRNSKLSEKLHNNPLISTPVIQYSIMKELIREFPSLSEAVRHLNCPNRGSAIKNILRSCNSDDATAYGYKWKLKTL